MRKCVFLIKGENWLNIGSSPLYGVESSILKSPHVERNGFKKKKKNPRLVNQTLILICNSIFVNDIFPK
ncbi:Olfactory receptor [Dirofilaria immitis]